MRWADIKIATTTESSEAVANLLMENGCSGAAIAGDSPVTVTGYLPVNDGLEQRLVAIREGVRKLPEFGLDAGSGEITVKYAEEQEWSDAWRSFFHTTRVGKRIVIKPTWEKFSAEKRDIVVEIDPGMAFGTGSHATTRLCLELLEKYLKPKSAAVDFGTGSGILAIAAAKLGASLVIAFDSDETAARAARVNVVQNDLEQFIEVHQADNMRFIGRPVDLITANIIAEFIIAQAAAFAHQLRIGGVLIASGITVGKADEVERALRNASFDILTVKTEGEWAAIAAVRAG